jgi:uncharacterized membrane protein YagU involved in acid resistance
MNLRVPIGFLLAPIVPCAVTVLPGILAQPEWAGGWQMIFLMVVVSQIISLVVAVPTYFLLRHYSRVGFWQCLLSGAAIAVVFNIVVLSLSMSLGTDYSAADSGGDTVINGHITIHGWVQNALSAGYFALLGAGIGFAFWLIAIWSPKKRVRAAA